MQFDSRQLAALATILRLGSFEAAAKALGVTPSAISQRLKTLEDQVGTVLVQRGTPCRGTDAGNRIAAHADAVALMEAQVTGDLGRKTPGDGPARVRIAVNADSLATWFPGALAGADGMLFDLVVDDETHSADWLRRGEVMAAVTRHARAVQGCDVHALGAMRYIATATPGFVARWFAGGVTPATLARAPVLEFNEKDGLQADWIARHGGPGLAPPVHRIPSTTGFVHAVEAGIGWALNPLTLVEAQLASGKLVALLPDSPYDAPLYWQVSRMLAPVLAPLTGAVKARARATMTQT